MTRLKDEWRKYVLGSIIILAMVLGGGPGTGLWTDTVLQLLILLAVAPILASSMGEPIDRRVLWFCGLIVAAILVQLLPLPEGLIAPFRAEPYLAGRLEDGGGAFHFISLGIGRTFEVFLYVVVLIGFTLALLRLRGEQVHALLPFLLAGVACNVIAAAIQYSAAQNVRLDGFTPFTITAGFFANRNHFAALLYASLPFLLYVGAFRGMAVWSGLSAIILLLVLLAAGSRAGAALGLAALVVSAIFLATRTRAGVGSVLAVVSILGVYSLGTWTLLERRELEDASRMEFARTTLSGISENWLFGVGYGNFERAYQLYENPAMIFSSYVNHVHNDYLELVFEGGIIAAVLILAYLIVLSLQLIRIRHSHFQKAAFLSILFILLHSTVDYPLRTMAVAVSFGYFNAVLFHLSLRPSERSKKRMMKVRHNGRDMNVPVEPAR